MLRALGSASYDLTHETGARFVSDTRDTGYDLLLALGSASCDITHETGGTICYAHWGLHLVISHTRQKARFVTELGSASVISPRRQRVRCVTDIVYHTRDRGYDLLRALGSASSDITHETKGTTCYGHLVLHLVISYTRQEVRFVTGIGFCFCDITQETEGTMCYGHWVLHLVLSHTRQGVRFVTGIGFCIL